MSRHDVIDRVAKAIYARQVGLTAEDANHFWSVVNKAERKDYRRDAVAAMCALKAGDHLTDSGDLRVMGWREVAPMPFVFDESED